LISVKTKWKEELRRKNLRLQGNFKKVSARLMERPRTNERLGSRTLACSAYSLAGSSLS
jgi:hypothetical protein